MEMIKYLLGITTIYIIMGFSRNNRFGFFDCDYTTYTSKILLKGGIYNVCKKESCKEK